MNYFSYFSLFIVLSTAPLHGFPSLPFMKSTTQTVPSVRDMSTWALDADHIDHHKIDYEKRYKRDKILKRIASGGLMIGGTWLAYYMGSSLLQWIFGSEETKKALKDKVQTVVVELAALEKICDERFDKMDESIKELQKNIPKEGFFVSQIKTTLSMMAASYVFTKILGFAQSSLFANYVFAVKTIRDQTCAQIEYSLEQMTLFQGTDTTIFNYHKDMLIEQWIPRLIHFYEEYIGLVCAFIAQLPDHGAEYKIEGTAIYLTSLANQKLRELIASFQALKQDEQDAKAVGDIRHSLEVLRSEITANMSRLLLIIEVA